MKYPISHSQRLEEIESIVNGWPVEKNFDHVLKWLMQFDSEDIDIGIRIIKNMNIIGYEDLNTSLTIAFSKLERVAIDKGSKITSRNTLFAGIGDGAKSGAMIGYNFRIVNELPEDNFLTDESIVHLESGLIENIVLVDDIIGTGNQATKEVKQLTEKVTPFGVKNIFLLTAVGMNDGIKSIIADTKAHVFSAFEYTDMDTASNLDSQFYADVPHEKRAIIKSRLEYYGQVTNKSPLGYGGIGALIAFYYNTPNISLPVIWGNRNSWIPLFKRATKINGITSYYKQIESSIAKKKKENKPIQGKEKELIVIVEGRIDEAFYEFLFSKIQSRIHFEKTSIISLGGYGSKTLIENIRRLSPNCLFIIEHNHRTPEQIKQRYKSVLGDAEIIEVNEFELFVDIEKLRKDERWSRLVNTIEELPNIDRPRRMSFDLRRRLQMQSAFQRDFFEQYLNEKLVNDLQDRIVSKVNSMVGTES